MTRNSILTNRLMSPKPPTSKPHIFGVTKSYPQIKVSFGVSGVELYESILELAESRNLSPSRQIVEMLEDVCYFEEMMEMYEGCIKKFESRANEDPTHPLTTFSEFMKEIRRLRKRLIEKRAGR